VRLLSFGLAVTLLTAHAVAQTPASGTATDRPTFEVASIRLNKSAVGGAETEIQPGGRASVTYTTVFDLTRVVFERQRHDLVAGDRLPSWVTSDRWDIVVQGRPIVPAKPTTVRFGQPNDADEATGRLLRVMMQNLLIDRFKLITRRETRTLPVYTLVAARTDRSLGARMRPSTADCAALSSAFLATGSRLAPNSPVCGLRTGLRGQLSGTGVLLSELTRALTPLAGRPVVDATGLTGAFDIELKWTPDLELRPVDGGVSVFTAIQEQLGLRLQPGSAPIDVMVVESAERPTDN